METEELINELNKIAILAEQTKVVDLVFVAALQTNKILIAMFAKLCETQKQNVAIAERLNQIESNTYRP